MAQKEDTILTPHQKDVLELLAHESYFTERFYFTGGTALAEFYLRHRLSEDLDFFSEQQEVNISAVTGYMERHTKVLRVKKFDTRNVLGLWTFFLTFFDSTELKVDFSYYPFPRIQTGVKFGKLMVDSAYDIAVNKVHTIAIKPRARDFIDLYFLIRKNAYDFRDLLAQAKAKFDWDITALQLGSSLLQASEVSDFPRMLKSIDHAEWQVFFIQEAKKLKDEVIE